MLASDLSLIRDAAQEAGKVALWHAKQTPVVTEKPDGAGPVTDADLAVNAVLKAKLLQARPDYGWLSEETPDSAERLEQPLTFIIDPIDGTRAFIARSPDWAHSIAVARGGEIVAAVVYLPARDALYAAHKGGGATLNGNPIKVSTAPDDMPKATVLTARPNLDGKHWSAGQPPPFQPKFRSSLAWRMCLVAEGRFDAMLTLRPTWEWDIAAGALILAEAGGIATDRTDTPLAFNVAHPQTDGVIAGTPNIHGRIAQALI